MISFNVSEYYSLDGLNEEEKGRVSNAVNCLNDFLVPKGDKLEVSQVGYRTCLHLKVNNCEIDHE